jgi:hypothetical protein
MTEVLVRDSVSEAERHAVAALAACSEGAALDQQLGAVRRALRFTPVNAVGLRRAISAKLRASERYLV